MEDDNKISYFFLGLGLGVAVGVLFAPKSGAEAITLRSRAEDGTDYVKRRANDLRDTAADAIDRSKETIRRQKENLRPRRCGQASVTRSGKDYDARLGSGGQEQTQEELRREFSEKMENQTVFLVIIAIFVAICAAAMIFQAAMLYGTYKATKEMRDRILPLSVKVDALVDISRSLVTDARTTIAEVTVKTNQILDVALEQMQMSKIPGDASLRTRRQLERAEIVVDDALNRAQDTVELVHKGFWLRSGINGVAAGVRAAMEFLLRGTRPSPDQVTVDEEMFI